MPALPAYVTAGRSAEGFAELVGKGDQNTDHVPDGQTDEHTAQVAAEPRAVVEKLQKVAPLYVRLLYLFE